MRIEVNGVRLCFDVEGAKLVPDGSVMREKPTRAAYRSCTHAIALADPGNA